MNKTMPIEFSYYIFIINICVLFLVYLITKNVLEFVFFYDKPKSFKRMYRKKHNFFYKIFWGFIFNRQYIQTTKHIKYLQRFYCFYLLLTVYGLALLFYTVLYSPKLDINSYFVYLEIIYVCIVFLYLLWYRLHCSGKGYHWWLPATWWKGSFQIDMSNLKKLDRKDN